MTRPAERNGLGLSVAEAEREVLAIEAGMILLPELLQSQFPQGFGAAVLTLIHFKP